MGKNEYAMFFEKISQALGLHLKNKCFLEILQNLEKAILPNSIFKDVWLDSIELKYLLYLSIAPTMVLMAVFYFYSHKYHLWFKRNSRVLGPKLIDIFVAS